MPYKTPEAQAEYYRRYYARTKEKQKSVSRAWYAANRERKKANSKKWGQKNRGLERGYRRNYREAHREEINARNRAKYHARKGTCSHWSNRSPAEVAKRLLAKAEHAVRYGYMGKLTPGGI
jgi:hypothetical protein